MCQKLLRVVPVLCDIVLRFAVEAFQYNCDSLNSLVGLLPISALPSGIKWVLRLCGGTEIDSADIFNSINNLF